MQDDKTHKDFPQSNEPTIGELVNFALSLRYELQEIKDILNNHLPVPVPSQSDNGSTCSELYTPGEVMEKLKVKDRTLYNYHKKGILCYIKIGGKRRYRKEEMDRFLKTK
ncbi:MAG: helix-turn-helix domain-containing protein [Bacteroidales bacterium]|nr:helix-turn-helix domain-containing protein [Bacteroidales bacterium]